jgi:hypothetical protein
MLRPARTISAFFLTAAVFLSASAHAEDKLFEIKKTEPKVAVGEKGAATVTVAAKAGWHLNAEAPITLALTPPAGMTIAKTKLERGDLAASTEQSARFDVAFEASQPGPKVVTAEARFVLCQASACKPVKETLSLTVDVSAAAPAKDKAVKKSKKKA